jgi:AmmeMemoRadiSam system protein B
MAAGLLTAATAGCAPAAPPEAAPSATACIRPAAVAGAFYPRDPQKLRAAVDAMLAGAGDVKPAGTPLAALAPHAGYVFSGRIAAFTHKAIAGLAFDTLVVIGHDTHRDGVAFLDDSDVLETPLGKVAVDTELARRLAGHDPGIRISRAMHASDHTVEVQLPFVQARERACRVLPVLFGKPTAANARRLADALAAAAGTRSLFVLASTDLSHYPPRDAARKTDLATLAALGELDPEKLDAYLLRCETRSEVPGLQTAMCARGGVMTAMFFARRAGADRVQVLRYANSGDVAAADGRRVVGYAAALMTKP